MAVEVKILFIGLLMVLAGLTHYYRNNSKINAICCPPCNNGGHCVAYNICSCSTNYTGLRCETLVTPTICSPPCDNGGHCVSNNTCACKTSFTGLHCEKLIRCPIEKLSDLGFNGWIKCSMSKTGSSCTLECPPGTFFSSPPATSYNCTFESDVFTPNDTPKCINGDGKEAMDLPFSRFSKQMR